MKGRVLGQGTGKVKGKDTQIGISRRMGRSDEKIVRATLMAKQWLGLGGINCRNKIPRLYF